MKNICTKYGGRVIRDRVQYWEIIADNLSKAGWSCGCVSGVDSRGGTIFVADGHRSDGKRFVVRADEKLTTFVELESANRNLIQGDGVFIKPDIKLLLSSYGFSVHGQLSMAASGASVLPRIATSPPPITSTMPRTTNSVGG